jgi:hypothetical protein
VHPDQQMLEAMYAMKPADVSVMRSAVAMREPSAVFVTARGSANDHLWTLMVERGWLVEKGDPRPDLPLDLVSYSVKPASWNKWAGFVVCAWEAFRNGMTPSDLIAVFEGKHDERLAHMLDARAH